MGVAVIFGVPFETENIKSQQRRVKTKQILPILNNNNYSKHQTCHQTQLVQCTKQFKKEQKQFNASMPSVTAKETTVLLLQKENEDERDKQNNSLVMTTIALAFALLVQSYLLVGVFPYSGFLVMHLIPGLTEETAGSYAGLIASSFMVGRTFSSFEWGKAADKYGRTFVIKTSLLLSAGFSILFGLAPTFSLCLLARFALGLSNGLIGPIKTVISEICHCDQAKETKIMAYVMGTWGYGFLINPAISGYLSDPVKQYPNSKFVELAGPLWRANPFLAPNIVGCIYCLIAYALVHFYVDETLPLNRRQKFGLQSFLPCWFQASETVVDGATLLRSVSSWGLFKHLNIIPAETRSDEDFNMERSNDNNHTTYDSNLPRWIRPSPSTTALVILSHRETHDRNTTTTTTTSVESNGVPEDTEPTIQEERPATIRSLWSRKITRQHLMVYWIYSFLVISVDEAFPLFCISKSSGLAITEKTIGNILSGTGVCYVALQYFLLTSLVDQFGFYKALRIGCLFSIPVVCLLPISLITNQGAPEGTLTWLTFVFLSTIYAVARAFSSVTFSTLTMTTNRTVPAYQRATMNCFSMLGGSLAKAAGPAFAGILFSTSVETITPPYGSVVVYVIIAFLGLCLFVKALFLPEHDPMLEDARKNSDKDKTLNAVKEESERHENDEDRPSF